MRRQSEHWRDGQNDGGEVAFCDAPVHGDRLAALHAVIPAGVLLGDGDDDDAALAGDHVPLGGELHRVAALGFAVVVPLHLLLGDDLAKTAGQVHSLPSAESWPSGKYFSKL